MDQKNQSIANSGNVVYRTMLEDLANLKKIGVSSEKKTAPVAPTEGTISDPFKETPASIPAKDLKKIDTKKVFTVLAGVIIATVFIVGGKFGYDWVSATFFTKEIIEESMPIAQESLFDVDKNIKIFLEEGDSLKSKLVIEGENLYYPELVHFVAYKDKVNPLSFDDLASMLDLRIPEAVKASLGTDYMLYVSVDNNNLDSRFRLNLAVTIDDVESLKSTIESWESSIHQDLAGLHLKTEEILEPASANFLSNVYKSTTTGEIIPIRYLNVADIYTTFDYAIVESKKYLLINTTKEAIFHSLETMLEKEEVFGGEIEIDMEMGNNTGTEEDLTESELLDIYEKLGIEMPQEEELNKTEELSMGSRQVLDEFAAALESDNVDSLSLYVAESKKEIIVDYLSGLEPGRRMELGVKLREEVKTMYEKGNIALYVVDCSFLDIEKECNFYLEKIGDEWKIVQM